MNHFMQKSHYKIIWCIIISKIPICPWKLRENKYLSRHTSACTLHLIILHFNSSLLLSFSDYFERMHIHLASTETYQFFRATLPKIYSTKTNLLWIWISYGPGGGGGGGTSICRLCILGMCRARDPNFQP